MEYEVLKKLADEGKTIKEMTEIVNRSYSNVRYWLKKHSINLKWRENVRNRRVKIIKTHLKDCYSYNQLCLKVYGCERGNAYQIMKQLIKDYNLDTSHFLNNTIRGKRDRLPSDEVLIYNRKNGHRETTQVLKRCLIEKGLNPHVCKICEQTSMWKNKPLVMQIDHIDGDKLNNVIENLRFICPNCHSQTKTFGSKNIKK